MSPSQRQNALTNLWTLRDQAILGIAQHYVAHPWPVTFLLIVDPLVSWIWLGAIIIALGGLLALWPIPVGLLRRRRAEAPVRHPVPPVREPLLEPVASVRDPV